MKCSFLTFFFGLPFSIKTKSNEVLQDLINRIIESFQNRKQGPPSPLLSTDKLNNWKFSKLKAGAPLSSVVSVLEARQQGSHRQGAARHLSRVREGDFLQPSWWSMTTGHGNFGRSVENDHNKFDIIAREHVWWKRLLWSWLCGLHIHGRLVSLCM